jgi:hypothetical protein
MRAAFVHRDNDKGGHADGGARRVTKSPCRLTALFDVCLVSSQRLRYPLSRTDGPQAKHDCQDGIRQCCEAYHRPGTALYTQLFVVEIGINVQQITAL